MKHLSKKALVTGGSSGIGVAIAKELVAEGAKVIITGRSKSTVQSTADEIRAAGIVSDQSNLDDIASLAETSEKEFGKLDILVLNAGVYFIAPFETVTENDYDSGMDINLKGVFFTLQRFVPILNDGASGDASFITGSQYIIDGGLINVPIMS